MQLQQQDWTPQQQALHELHSRYERGELSAEDFERGLDKLLQAKTQEECWAIMQEFSSLRAVQAQEGPSQMAQPPSIQLSPAQWMVSLIGEIKRTQRPWKVAPQTTIFMGIGETELDLSMAALPQSGTLQVYMLIGEVKIYVPRSIHVTVSTTTLLGEVNALGQKSEGIIAHSSAESFASGTSDPSTRHLDIQAHIVLGEVRIVQVDNPIIIEKMIKKQGKKDKPRLKYDTDYAELPQG